MPAPNAPRIPATAADYLEWVFEASSQYPATGPTPPRKKPAMIHNNPFMPAPQRPERWDETWQRRRDPIAYQAVREVTRRGY